MVNTIWFWFDLIWFQKYFFVWHPLNFAPTGGVDMHTKIYTSDSFQFTRSYCFYHFIWNQTRIRLVRNKSRNDKYNLILVNWKKIRIWFVRVNSNTSYKSKVQRVFKIPPHSKYTHKRLKTCKAASVIKIHNKCVINIWYKFN